MPSDLLAVPLGAPDRLGDPFCQQQPIGQAGEHIVLGQMRHLQRQSPRFADVVEHEHRAGDLAVPVVDGRGGILDRGFEAVAADQHTIRGQPYSGVSASMKRLGELCPQLGALTYRRLPAGE